MPQLWLTYQELGDELRCAAVQARQTAINRSWTRKHSSDGQTRVLLPRDLMQRYFATQAFGSAGFDVAPAAEPLRSALRPTVSGRF